MGFCAACRSGRAARISKLAPDVILAGGTASVAAVLERTSAIPAVFARANCKAPGTATTSGLACDGVAERAGL